MSDRLIRVRDDNWSFSGTRVVRRVRARMNALPADAIPLVASEGTRERRVAHRAFGEGVAVSDRSVRGFILRGVNLAVAVISLVVLAPVMLLIAVAIKLDSRGPVFYRQLRIGLDRRREDDRPRDENERTADLSGRPFVMYKYRTMHMGAETETGPVWTGGFDSRVTRVGRFLRRHRLDELPQLWNVVIGDMSIVGPRPERPGFVHDLKHEIDGYYYRHRVRPGITGLAQINRESDTSIDDVRRKLDYDLEYIRRRSLRLDLYVMMFTLLVMVRGEQLARPGEGEERENR